MKSALWYTVARLALVGAAAGVLFLIGVRGWPLAFGAVALSLPLSWFLLRKQREAMSDSLVKRGEQRAREKAKLRAALRGDDSPTESEFTDAGTTASGTAPTTEK